MDEVKGPQHPRIVELRRQIGRRSSRSTEILIEGPRTIGEALDAEISLVTVVIAESAVDDVAVATICDRLAAATEILVVRDKAFERLAPSVTPQPMLALAVRPSVAIPEVFAADDLALVLIDVGDPGNVGTLIRVGDAVGAACVVVAGGADPWSPKSVRSSAGSAMRVPVISGVDADWALRALSEAGAKIVATDVRQGEPHDSGVLTGPVAIVLGSEPHGLDHSIDPLVDAWVRIDMPGNAESLNVAMAGTLLAYEARRSESSG